MASKACTKLTLDASIPFSIMNDISKSATSGRIGNFERCSTSSKRSGGLVIDLFQKGIKDLRSGIKDLGE